MIGKFKCSLNNNIYYIYNHQNSDTKPFLNIDKIIQLLFPMNIENLKLIIYKNKIIYIDISYKLLMYY